MRIICSGFPIFELGDFFRNIAGYAELCSSYAIGHKRVAKKSGIIKCRFFIAARCSGALAGHGCDRDSQLGQRCRHRPFGRNASGSMFVLGVPFHLNRGAVDGSRRFSVRGISPFLPFFHSFPADKAVNIVEEKSEKAYDDRNISDIRRTRQNP